MICTMSKHEAEANGCDDALMLDWRGHLAEGTGANLFLVINGELHTPTPDCFLNGITGRRSSDRQKQRGIKVVERPIMPEELAKADELFLTGSAAEVTPVGEIIGEHGHYLFTPGTICRLMWEDYDRKVGKQVASAAWRIILPQQPSLIARSTKSRATTSKSCSALRSRVLLGPCSSGRLTKAV